MALKIIAVDTSQAASYSCTAFGYEIEISQLHDEISKAMFGKKGYILHWAKTSKKIKKKAQKKVFDAIEKSKSSFMFSNTKNPPEKKRRAIISPIFPTTFQHSLTPSSWESMGPLL